jgi:nucleotide-binding universal stress UspA family protein
MDGSARLDELAAWTQLADREDVTPRLVLLDGEPVATLDQLADLERPSLVVCGTEPSDSTTTSCTSLEVVVGLDGSRPSRHVTGSRDTLPSTSGASTR